MKLRTTRGESVMEDEFFGNRNGGKCDGERDTLSCTTDPAAGSHTVKSSVIRLLAARVSAGVRLERR